MPKPLVSLSKPKWTQNVEKSGQGEKLGSFFFFLFFGEAGPHAVWHTATRLRVTLCGDVPTPFRAGHREMNTRSFHSLPTRVAGKFLSTSSERTRAVLRDSSRNTTPTGTGAAAPRARENPSGSQDGSACSITTRSWQPTQIYSLSLSF